MVRANEPINQLTSLVVFRNSTSARPQTSFLLHPPLPHHARNGMPSQRSNSLRLFLEHSIGKVHDLCKAFTFFKFLVAFLALYALHQLKMGCFMPLPYSVNITGACMHRRGAGEIVVHGGWYKVWYKCALLAFICLEF